MNARVLVVSSTMFAVAAALGAGFAVFGPVSLVRLLGAIALACGAAGCALQVYALRHFAPRVYKLLERRLRGGVHPATATPTQRTILAGYR